MYRVYSDGLLLYHSKLENLKIFNPSVELEVNKTGSFQFVMYPDHTRYNLIQKLKSIITVYQDDYLLFRGRVLDDEIGWHNEKTIICEGDLAFLLDSIVRPYDFSGTIRDYLKMLLDSHNAQVEAEKRFVLGNVTVTDANDYIVRSNIDYTDTWTELNDKLLNLLGGYIIVRHENGVHYIDYLKDINLLAPQKITFGKNLLDLKRIRKGADIATAVIPLGAKLEGSDSRLTIASVNNGSDTIVDEEAKAQYGFIVKTVIFDDVTDANNLLTKGKAHLAGLVNLMESIELSAADLATVDNDITSFHIGTQVRVTSDPHRIDQLFMVSKLSVNLLDPAANHLTLGKTISTFSETVVFKKGDPGRDGHDGKDGQPGSAGRDGVNGKDGQDGKDGLNGKDGANGKDAAVQSLTAPSDTSYMWLDISLDPPILKRYNTETASWVIVNDTTEIIYNLEQNLEASIVKSEQDITLAVSESYYLKDETDSLISSIGTQIEQTANAVEIQFDTFRADIESVAANTDAEFEAIHNYIRFEDGNIIQGGRDSPFQKVQSATKESYYDSGTEVAYFSNKKLYVTDGEYTHSLRVGKLIVTPRSNGNTSINIVT